MSAVWLYPIPDPFATGDLAASYTTDATARRFMGDQLVECRDVTDPDTGETQTEMWIVGDTAELATGEGTLLATDVTSGGVPNTSAMGATTDKVFVVLAVANESGDPTYLYWVVGADGSQAFFDAPFSSDVSLFLIPDQRLEASLRDLPVSTSELLLTPIVPGDSAASADVAELDSNNALGSTWGAIVLGDVSVDREQPTAPDPFEVTETSIGHHTSDGALVFDFSDETGDQFGAWEDATISWAGPAEGAPSSMNLGLFGVSTTFIFNIPRDDGGGESSVLPSDSGSISAYVNAYGLPTLSDGSARPGQLTLTYNASLETGTPDDYMTDVEASIAGVRTIIPVAPHAYKQGEYRYVRNGVDDQSAYVEQGKGAPGSEYMWSQLFEDVAGRWTGVVSLQQDADNYGEGTACSLCVYFDPSVAGPGVLFAAPLRRYPRDDGLATSSARRLYPPNRSIQRSNRLAGGYL